MKEMAANLGVLEPEWNKIQLIFCIYHLDIFSSMTVECFFDNQNSLAEDEETIQIFFKQTFLGYFGLQMASEAKCDLTIISIMASLCCMHNFRCFGSLSQKFNIFTEED